MGLFLLADLGPYHTPGTMRRTCVYLSVFKQAKVDADTPQVHLHHALQSMCLNLLNRALSFSTIRTR